MALVFLDPNGIGSNDAWTVVGAATKYEAATRPDDDATTYITGTGGSPSQDLTLTDPTGILFINSVSVVMRAAINNAGAPSNEQVRCDLLLDGNVTTGAVLNTTAATAPFQTVEAEDLARPGGGDWQVSDLASLQLRCTGPVTTVASSVLISTCYVLVDCTLIPSKVGAARDVGSRVVRALRRPVSTVTLSVPLRYADVELLDDIPLSHFAGPIASTCSGFGVQTWQRRLLRVIGTSLNLSSMTVDLNCLDVRDYLVSFWDTMISKEPPTEIGAARLDPGAQRSYTRASDAYVENPAVAAQNAKQVVKLIDDSEKLDTNGTLIESSGQNELLKSSFVSGTSGLTISGTSGGGTATIDDVLLFETAVTTGSLLLTAGNPHTVDLSVQFPTTASLSANTIVSASLDHKDNSGTALSVRLRRNVDSFYWDHGTNAWTSVVTNNVLTVRSTSIERDQLASINIGTSASTLTLFAILPSSGTASRTNSIFHAQLEQRRYASSRIVADSTAVVTRSADHLKIENFHGVRVWPIQHGTAFVQFMPEWNSSELASGATMMLLDAYYDSENFDRVFWDQASTGFIFRRRLDGVDYDAVKTGALTRGTLYGVAARWTGDEGEEGLSDFTISVFVDGTKGTDATPGAVANSITSTGYLNIGADFDGANQADGWLRHLTITPFVLSDEEIGDLP